MAEPTKSTPSAVSESAMTNPVITSETVISDLVVAAPLEPQIEVNLPGGAEAAAEALDLTGASKKTVEVAAVTPVLDLVVTNRRNMTALVSAQRSVTEGYLALAQKQGQILREAIETAQSVLSEGTGKDGVTPVEYAQNAIQTALANMKELAELATKTNKEAIAIVNNRIKESLGELKTLRAK